MQIRIGSHFWKSDWHLSLLLGLLLVVVFILYPLGSRGTIIGILIQSFFSLILISGVAIVAVRRVTRIIGALLAVGTATVGLVRLYMDDGILTVVGVSLWILFFVALTGLILLKVFSEGKINFHRIQGAIAVYLLLGVTWSGLYRLIVYFDPGAFNMPSIKSEAELMSRLVYFSFVTMTTVGYGDIVAVHPMARSMAMVQALTGQLFPAVLIARLVSMELSHQTPPADTDI